MKRSKAWSVLDGAFVFVFFAVLCLVAILTVFRPKAQYSFFENRNLAVFPELKSETVLDGTYFKDLDTYIQDHAAGRELCLKSDTFIDLYVLRRPVINDRIVVAGDVLLPYKEYSTVDTAAIETGAEAVSENLLRHSEEVREYGGEFYFVAVPCQYVCYEDSYPWYLNNLSDYTEASSSALFSKLDEKGVKYVDMRAVASESGSLAGYSSKVDNHFGIEGAYQTYRAVMERIKEDGGPADLVLNDGDYSIEYLPNKYLGSRGRQLFGLWETDEKLAVIYPKEEIPFERYDNDNVFPLTAVYSIPAENEEALYSLYMAGDIGRTEIRTGRDGLPDVLIYGDSFTNAVECVAWYSFDTTYTVDFRHYKDKTLSELIEERKPDIVICIRDYEAFLTAFDNGQ